MKEFVRNHWYVAGWDWEIRREALFRRVILNEPVVMYRDQEGNPVALEDRCSHRHAPLSEGQLDGNNVVCPYHGIQFAPDGACAHVPSQSTIPPNAGIRSYPVVEKHHWIWIWTGDPAKADPALIEDYSILDDPDWRFRGETLHFDGDYQLVIDNVLDLTHLSFLHQTTLGTDKVAATPIKTTRDGNDKVTVTRWIMDSPPAPLYQMVGHFDGNVDRRQVIEFTAPCHLKLKIGSVATGSKLDGDDFVDGVDMRTLISITPETDTSCHYFRTICHNFATDDASISEMLFHGGHEAMVEDQGLIGLQQKNMGSADWVDFNQDAGGIQARNIVNAMIEAEKTEMGIAAE